MNVGSHTPGHGRDSIASCHILMLSSRNSVSFSLLFDPVGGHDAELARLSWTPLFCGLVSDLLQSRPPWALRPTSRPRVAKADSFVHIDVCGMANVPTISDPLLGFVPLLALAQRPH